MAGGDRPRVLVFLHGTVIMHSGGAGLTRSERVAQSRAGGGHGLRDFGSYVAIGDSVAKLQHWARQGAEIAYLSSHRSRLDIQADEAVLRRHGFPPGPVFGRVVGETYADVVERQMPDVLIEDDCESIGAEEIAYHQLNIGARRLIRSIIVPEFGGIDHLPERLEDLAG